jgi:hypothetical protein
MQDFLCLQKRMQKRQRYTRDKKTKARDTEKSEGKVGRGMVARTGNTVVSSPSP